MNIESFLSIAEEFFSPKQNGTKRVLILEDDRNEGEILSDVVTAMGFQPELFVSQRDAERSMDRVKYIAAVFDLKLADGDGAAAQRIFERKFPDSPSLIVSGNEDALMKIIQSGLSISVTWKGSDFRFMEMAVKKMLHRAKRNGSGNRWTTREVLLFLAIIGATNYATWQLAAKMFAVSKL